MQESGAGGLLTAGMQMRSSSPGVRPIASKIVESDSGPAAPEVDQSAPRRAGRAWAPRGGPTVRLALRVLLVGLICHLSTEIGFAHKLPPHQISVLWPTNAILFSVLVVTPLRHWWVFTVAAFFTSVINDARAGFPPSGIAFLVGDVIEVFIAAAGVRRLAHGVRAFDSLRGLVAYLATAVVLAPVTSAFVGALAGTAQDYGFYWRVWFLSEALAYVTLAPAILTWIGAARTTLRGHRWRGASKRA